MSSLEYFNESTTRRRDLKTMPYVQPGHQMWGSFPPRMYWS